MSQCKANTKAGKRCKNTAKDNSKYCGLHLDADKILHPKKVAMIKALEKHLGVITTACKEVSITRQTHYKWLKDDERYAESVEDVANAALDFAESELFKQIRQGIPTSTIFYLKTKGKNRGYIEKQEHDHTTKGEKITGSPIIVTNPKGKEPDEL